ncbi:zinc ABC transporter substrate-binding protein [candidate division KSB1 bacterium]|nr:zinc ABC transporter substrate-binding protein [candidate division KSB1 bacterium]
MIYHKNFQLLILLLVVGAMLISCSKPPADQDRIVVATSILPLMDFARQVGGDRVDAFAIVPPGVNPHIFELTPEILIKTSRAKLLILNGIGLEFWADDLISNLQQSDIVVIETSKGVEVLEADDHTGGNPHIWLDPVIAMHQVRQICAGLCRVDSIHADYYRTREARYIADLQKLDEEIRMEIAGWRSRAFICFHPSWRYFAESYGLVQAAVIEKHPGFEPNPKDVAEIIRVAQEIKARAIFAEKQFPVKISQAIAAECNIHVIRLDPLGSDAEQFNYIQLLKENVRQMALALK